jgi:hypothetical protein
MYSRVREVAFKTSIAAMRPLPSARGSSPLRDDVTKRLRQTRGE